MWCDVTYLYITWKYTRYVVRYLPFSWCHGIYMMYYTYINKMKNVSCENDQLKGWNSTLQAAWYIRHVRWTCLFCISYRIWCLWTNPTIWLLIPSFTNFTEGRSRVFFRFQKHAAQLIPVGFCSIPSENVKTAVCDLSRSGWCCC